jgi:hypothetical protein
MLRSLGDIISIFQMRHLRLSKVSPWFKVTELENREQECEPSILVSKAPTPKNYSSQCSFQIWKEPSNLTYHPIV